MKKLISITAIVTVLGLMILGLMLTGCQQATEVAGQTVQNETNPQIEAIHRQWCPFILLTLADGGATPTGLEILITNLADSYLETADPAFWIERMVDGAWLPVEPHRERLAHLLISAPLPAGETRPFGVRWNYPYAHQSYYGELPNGNYRIIMGFPNWSGGVRSMRYAAVEFSLGEEAIAERKAALQRANLRFAGITAEFVALDRPNILIRVQNDNPYYSFTWRSEMLRYYNDGEWSLVTNQGAVSPTGFVDFEEHDNIVSPGEYSVLWLTWHHKDDFILPGRHRLPVSVYLILDDEYMATNNLHFRDMQATFYVEFNVD